MRRRIWLVVASVAVVLAALSWAAYRYLTVQQTGEVAIPADQASPEQVVRAYVEALDAHDCDTAATLNPDDLWCEDVESMDLIELRPVHSARARHVELPVRLDFEWRPFFFDVSMDDGRISWGFILERDSRREPWRIVDQGVG
jgi:hypothetical protein